MTSIARRWRALDEALRAAGTPGLELGPSGSEAELMVLEAELGARLPDDVRASLLAHAWIRHPELSWLPAGSDWLELGEIRNIWRLEQNYADAANPLFDALCCEDRVRALVFHPLRIPLAYAELATAGIYCDLVPGPAGRVGQLIHNVDEAAWCVLADSVDDLLARYPQLLAAGALRVEVDDDYTPKTRVRASHGQWSDDPWETIALVR